MAGRRGGRPALDRMSDEEGEWRKRNPTATSREELGQLVGRGRRRQRVCGGRSRCFCTEQRRQAGSRAGDRRQATVLEAGRQPRRADRRSRPLQVSQLLFCQALSHPPAQNRAPVRPPRRWVGPRRQGNHHPSGLRWQAAWPRSGRWAVPSTGVAAVRPTGGSTTAWLPLQPYLGLQQVSSRLAAPSPPNGWASAPHTWLLCHTQPSCCWWKACFCPSCGLGRPARCSGTSGSKSSSPKHPILAGSRSRGALSGPLSHTHLSLFSSYRARAGTALPRPRVLVPRRVLRRRRRLPPPPPTPDDKTPPPPHHPKPIPPTAFLPLSRVSTAHHNSGRAQPSSLSPWADRPRRTTDLAERRPLLLPPNASQAVAMATTTTTAALPASAGGDAAFPCSMYVRSRPLATTQDPSSAPGSYAQHSSFLTATRNVFATDLCSCGSPGAKAKARAYALN